MENFTPYTAFSGGILIGLSVTIMLFFNGRITGVSGIIAGLLAPKTGEWLWRLIFLIGMISGSTLFVYLYPETFTPRAGFPTPLLVIGGLLVGFGTRLGNGCTSGHGICGIARLSLRSIVATVIFMLSGAVTVFITRHIMTTGAFL
ncbi:MAG: YeeE/YedE family protein [Methylococcales bacterium]|nr:YeeE/YedE family protein [Methylococcales bacterium]